MRDYLKRLRLEKQYTQKEVAEALNISQNYYSCIENGLKQKEISFILLLKFAEFFDVDINELIAKETDWIRCKTKGA